MTHPPIVETQCYFAIVAFLSTGITASAADWPHWRGPDRNDLVSEPSGWRDGKWRLQELWRANTSEGSSSPIIVDNRLYTLGWASGREHLVCLDTKTGREIWKQSYRAPKYGRQSVGDKSLYSGPSSTPEFDVETGYIFTLGNDGDLQCRDAAKRGGLVWSLNLYDKYGAGKRPDVGGKRGGASRRDYGYTTSPLVHGHMLIVEVGDTRRGAVIGFDKRTGDQLWTSECRDEAGHTGGAVPMTVDGIPCAVVLTMRNLIVLRLDAGREGQTLASFPWTTDFANNIPTPAVHGNSVIVTTAYNHYMMCRVDISRTGATKIWELKHPSGVCSPVIHDGHIYWAWRGIHCADFQTGKQLWQGAKVATPGSCLITSDNRLIALGDRGDLYLVETAGRSRDKYTELARRSLRFKRDAWPHAVLSNGQLYGKDRDGNIVCFAVN